MMSTMIQQRLGFEHGIDRSIDGGALGVVTAGVGAEFGSVSIGIGWVTSEAASGCGSLASGSIL
jgi:hypothetical protein